MKTAELLFEGVDYIIEKIPIVGGLKKAVENGYPTRILSNQELKTNKWLRQLAIYINNIFHEGMYRKTYDAQKLLEWIEVYPDTFTVLVRRKIIAWPVNKEQIISTVKILPLRIDLVLQTGFDPSFIKATDLTRQLEDSKAVWIGDLTSSKKELMIMFLAIKNKVEHVKAPIYFRTANNNLRTILFERYGAKVLHPSGGDADANTILVLNR